MILTLWKLWVLRWYIKRNNTWALQLIELLPSLNGPLRLQVWIAKKKTEIKRAYFYKENDSNGFKKALMEYKWFFLVLCVVVWFRMKKMYSFLSCMPTCFFPEMVQKMCAMTAIANRAVPRFSALINPFFSCQIKNGFE